MIKNLIINTKSAIAAASITAAIASCLSLAACRPAPSEALAQAEDYLSEQALSYVVMPRDVDNKIIEYTGFTVAFNPLMHQPNYVVWELRDNELDGPNTRKDAKFMQDTRVDGCATLDDYRGSGFDRGHMAPAADMKWDPAAMADCHFLTNISPQTHKLNNGAWNTLENRCRNWAKKFGRVIIITGPVLSDKLNYTIGRSGIPVPERFFKVILAPDENPPRGLAFIMENSQISQGLDQTVTTIRQVEEITGFDFFSALPDDQEQMAETSNNYLSWDRISR